MAPRAAYTSLDVPLTISGEGFEPVATQQVGHGGGLDVDSSFRAFLGTTELKDVRWQATDRLTATVPAGGRFGETIDVRLIGDILGENAAEHTLRTVPIVPDNQDNRNCWIHRFEI